MSEGLPEKLYIHLKQLLDTPCFLALISQIPKISIQQRDGISTEFSLPWNI